MRSLGSRAHSLAKLVWWLGINPSVERLPTDVWRRELRACSVSGGAPSTAALFGPSSGQIRGGFFVIPGIHYAGPSDPRLDRLLRVLASAGFLVYAPYLADLQRLCVTAESVDACCASFAHFMSQPLLPEGARPSVFAISYGSLLGFRLASDLRYRDQITSLFVFGGYADWATSLRFALTGQVGDQKVGVNDPLNRPVVYINVADQLFDDPNERALLCDLWRRFVAETWGRPEMKAGGYVAHAERLARDLPEHLRLDFLAGCGIGRADLEFLSKTVVSGEVGALLDPRPYLAAVRPSVHLVHGRDDDVVPYTQIDELKAGLPAGLAQSYLTGLYGHATNVGLLSQLENLPLLVDELRTLGAIAWALSAA
jgi:pimeloyl-ACP methyl ester carboxylesterase